LRSALDRVYNLTGAFHLVIIAMFLLSLSGCGYKDDPYYLENAPQGDSNIKFIIKKSDNNESDNENR
jgi:predicted small lipoprotein YifL